MRYFNQEYVTILFCSLILLRSSICTLASTLSDLDGNLLDNNLPFDFSGTELKAEYSCHKLYNYKDAQVLDTVVC